MQRIKHNTYFHVPPEEETASTDSWKRTIKKQVSDQTQHLSPQPGKKLSHRGLHNFAYHFVPFQIKQLQIYIIPENFSQSYLVYTYRLKCPKRIPLQAGSTGIIFSLCTGPLLNLKYYP